MKLFYICHSGHPNNRVYAENLSEFFGSQSVAHRIIEFDPSGNKHELLVAAARSSARGVIGFNWELDHAWIDSRNFVDIAAENKVPMVHWMFDHPSAVWPRFTRNHGASSGFLFHSAYAESYFHKYVMNGCVSGHVVSSGVNHRSRLPELKHEEFLTRDIACMLPLNLRRLGGRIEDAEQRLTALPSGLRTAVEAAIASAQDDLDHPIERHFPDDSKLVLERPDLFHQCIQIVEEIVQVRRRLAVFSIAAEFPVLIQSDLARAYLHERRIAKIEENVSMQETIARMQQARAVVSLTHINDEIHNRTVNALNAGSVNIIEDNIVHRRYFTHGKNALLFRYGDDSFRHCLDIVCSNPRKAFEIAQAGFAMRDDPRLRFGGYQNILRVVKELQVRSA